MEDTLPAGPENERPDRNETPAQRVRYDRAQEGYRNLKQRVETAINSFSYTRDQFHQIEDEFLALAEELRRTDAAQMRNLSHLEGLRLRLLTSIDGPYRHAVNELADSLLVSIGLPKPSGSDGASPTD